MVRMFGAFYLEKNSTLLKLPAFCQPRQQHQQNRITSLRRSTCHFINSINWKIHAHKENSSIPIHLYPTVNLDMFEKPKNILHIIKRHVKFHLNTTSLLKIVIEANIYPFRIAPLFTVYGFLFCCFCVKRHIQHWILSVLPPSITSL